MGSAKGSEKGAPKQRKRRKRALNDPDDLGSINNVVMAMLAMAKKAKFSIALGAIGYAATSHFFPGQSPPDYASYALQFAGACLGVLPGNLIDDWYKHVRQKWDLEREFELNRIRQEQEESEPRYRVDEEEKKHAEDEDREDTAEKSKVIKSG
jgi:hypothetical protein